MATAKLTLIGLYNYDSTLFDGLQLPEYFDKETLVSTILLAGGEFPTLYPNGDFMKQAISLWSAKNQRYFERLAILMQSEYDPLENYNRREHWTDAGESENENTTTNTTNGTTSAQFNNTKNGTTSTQSNNTTSGTDGSTTENKVSAYNSSTYENRDISTTSGTNSETVSGTSSGTNSETDAGTSSGTSTETGTGTSNGSSNYEVNRDGYARGNIGVTTSQEMFRQEMEIVSLSPYDVIAGDFINEFCIKLYV